MVWTNLDNAQCFILDLRPARCETSDCSLQEKKRVRGRCTVYTTRRLLGYFLLAKISHLEPKKNDAHSIMKSPNSMMSTSCRTVDTRLMKEKNSLLQEYNTSTQFLNQSDTNPLGAPELLVGSLSNVFLRMNNSCVTTFCSCCNSLYSLLQVFLASW